jgi:hypothetical protein
MHSTLAQAAVDFGTFWTIVLSIISMAAGIIGGLALFNLTGLKDLIQKVSERQDQTEEELKDIRKDHAAFRVECERDMVSKEDWVRNEGYVRRELKEMSGTLSTINGKLEVISRMPEISAEIAARTAERVLQEVRKS